MEAAGTSEAGVMYLSVTARPHIAELSSVMEIRAQWNDGYCLRPEQIRFLCSMEVLMKRQSIKVNVQVKYTLEQVTKAQRGVELQLYSFFNLSARRWVVNDTPRPLYPRKNPVAIV